MPRYALFFSYIGKNYQGVSKLENCAHFNCTTVEGLIDAALGKLNPARKIPEIYVSSRTDAGVHALENVAHVDLSHPVPGLMFTPDFVTNVVNDNLAKTGEDIWISKVLLVPYNFHCRIYALQRTYLYRLAIFRPPTFHDQLSLDKFMSVLPSVEHQRCYVIKEPFNVETVRETTEILTGTHNFHSFVGTSKELKKRKNENYIREVKVQIQESQSLMDSHISPLYQNLKFYDVFVSSKSFLYNQVRRIVAALQAVGSGYCTPKYIENMLKEPDRYPWDPRFMLAPPHALYLVNIKYNKNEMRVTENDYKGLKYDSSQKDVKRNIHGN